MSSGPQWHSSAVLRVAPVVIALVMIGGLGGH
jgi:hypothetical protein